MLRVNKYAYIYAKIFGIISRSYLGEKVKEVARLKHISSLYEALFPDAARDHPEQTLSVNLQARVIENCLESILKVIGFLKKPDAILILLLRKYEVQTIKAVIRFLAHPESEFPHIWPLKTLKTVNFRGKDTVKADLQASPYAWIIGQLDQRPAFEIENQVDRLYYRDLYQAAMQLPAADKQGVLQIIAQEILFQNICWALRLRFYYQYDKERAAPLLIPVKRRNFREILQVFDLAVDDKDGWRRWKYAYLIEDQLNLESETIDPSQAEARALGLFYTKVSKTFHKYPFTLSPIVCFIKLKEMEADILKTIIEGLRMQLPWENILKIIG